MENVAPAVVVSNLLSFPCNETRIYSVLAAAHLYKANSLSKAVPSPLFFVVMINVSFSLHTIPKWLPATYRPTNSKPKTQ